MTEENQMDRRHRIFAPMLAIALTAIAGFGIYSYSLQYRLDATRESIDALERDRNIWKAKAEKAEGVIETASASLDHCSAEIDTLKSQLIVAPASPR